MFQLILVGQDIFVYDIKVWTKLRKEHRIIGNIVGSTNFIPSLPVKLLPEEVLLLLDKNLAEVVESNSGGMTSEEHDCDFEKQLLQAQQDIYKELRRAQLTALIEKILESRRKIGDQRSEEDIFQEELEKSSVVTRENMIWPILLRDPNQDCVKVSRDKVLTLTSPLKLSIFKDLWEKGFFVTSGEKFGGHFLGYYGDPIVHHAVFIVKCVNLEQTFSPTELIAFGRLGVSVKKKAVLASSENGNVINYLTINWIDA